MSGKVELASRKSNLFHDRLYKALRKAWSESDTQMILTYVEPIIADGVLERALESRLNEVGWYEHGKTCISVDEVMKILHELLNPKKKDSGGC